MLLPLHVVVKAQDTLSLDSIRFSGMIFDKDSLEVLPYAKYAIHDNSFLANNNGEFHVWVKKGDLLKFSYVGYKDTYIQINDTLDTNNYLIGVFLSKDTVQLSEVIVVPRYQQLLLEAKYSPLMINPEYVNANRNVKAATRQALTQSPERMDAEANQQMVIHEQTMKTVYKTQVPPDMIFGIHSDRLIPYIMYLSKKKKMKIRETNPETDVLSQKETRFLLNLYKQRQNKLKPGNKESVVIKKDD